MHVADHLPLDELRTLADAAAQTRRFLRVRAVILACEGRTAPEVAAALGCSRRAAQGWVARYWSSPRIASAELTVIRLFRTRPGT